jgi:type IV secretion system protein TrbF
MRLRRSQVRYSTTPAPVTPYQSAAQAWDERIGTARVQATRWMTMAFACFALVMILCGALLWQSSRSLVTPYVIEVEAGGAVRAVGEAATPYVPTDAQIAYHLARFVSDVRSLPIDPIVLRQQWLKAYDYVTDRGAIALNDYARAADPFGRVGNQSIAVEVTSVVRASDRSFQVRWIERQYVDGALRATERWTGIVTLVLQVPRTDERVRKNPLGICWWRA